jgi:hypothetical protein
MRQLRGDRLDNGVYRFIDDNVYRKSTGQLPVPRQRLGFRGNCAFSADYHQQYLAKNPNGYCGLEGYGVTYAPSMA